MNEEHVNREIRKFLKEVGVTSQQEIERLVHDGQGAKGTLSLRMKLTVTAGSTSLEHVVERTIDISDQ
jgi:hypothetical protein